MIKETKLDVKSVDAMASSNDTKKKITSIRNRLTRCKKKAMNEVDPNKKETLLIYADELRMEEIEACNEMVNRAKETELGGYYQIGRIERVSRGIEGRGL